MLLHSDKQNANKLISLYKTAWSSLQAPKSFQDFVNRHTCDWPAWSSILLWLLKLPNLKLAQDQVHMWQSHFWLQFKINWTAHTVFKITEPQCLDSWNKNTANNNLLSYRIRKRMSSYKETNIILKATHCLSLGAFSSPVPARLLTLTLSLLPFACGRRTPLSVYATSGISLLEKGLLLFL